jgi:hypothetical protein
MQARGAKKKKKAVQYTENHTREKGCEDEMIQVNNLSPAGKIRDCDMNLKSYTILLLVCAHVWCVDLSSVYNHRSIAVIICYRENK